jgi:hypothetical protein
VGWQFPAGRRARIRARERVLAPEVIAALPAELVPDEARDALDSLRTQVALAWNGPTWPPGRPRPPGGQHPHLTATGPVQEMRRRWR